MRKKKKRGDCSNCELAVECRGVHDETTFRKLIERLPKDCVARLRARLRETKTIRVRKLSDTIRRIHEVEDGGQ